MLFAGILILQIINIESVKMYEELLDQFKWKKRILLLSSSSWDHPSFSLSRERLARAKEGFEEREVLVLSIIREDVKPAGILQFEDSGTKVFEARLIGKDGTEKFRTSGPIDSKQIFRLIDSMPMRQREMFEMSQ